MLKPTCIIRRFEMFRRPLEDEYYIFHYYNYGYLLFSTVLMTSTHIHIHYTLYRMYHEDLTHLIVI